ncbi:hypothetical protein T492DRAFT_912975 [Pavlovales sp. CCMP2436]|nr:hypothetical protein T492DRAFT_912975 [Pavlovales sp. CCMP2436]
MEVKRDDGATTKMKKAADSQPDCTAFRLAREMAEASWSGQRPRRASTRLLARTESALPPLLRALAGDLLHAVPKLLDDADLLCARLACTAFRDHSSPAQKKCRVGFLRTCARVVFACERMPGFVPVATPPGAESDDDDDSEDDEPTPLLSLAAFVGVVGVLAELVDNRQLTSHLAARGGHLEVPRYAHEHGCPWKSDTCTGAALGGHLEVLRYVHEHGCPWDSWTCHGAAREGHLEVLRYAHEHGCPWDSATYHYAALEGNSRCCGHLEVLRYAHEHGCPWDLTAALLWL